jgi:predicted ATPase
MIKLVNISVNNFKNIMNTDIEIKNFNVIVGPNNSGKSNFILIIPFLDYIINGSLDSVQKSMENGFFPSGFGVIANRISKNKLEIDISLQYFDTISKNLFKYQIKISYEVDKEYHLSHKYKIFYENLEYKNIHNTGKNINIFSREKSDINFGKDISKKNIKSIPDYASVFRFLSLIIESQEITKGYKDAINGMKHILNAPIFYFSNIELKKTDDEKRIKSFGSRTIAVDIEYDIFKLKESKDKWKIFAETINNLLDITKIYADSFPIGKKENKIKYFVYLTHLGSGKLLDELSDGSLLLISLVTEVFMSKSDIIFIEEPENSIHPKALKDLILFLRSYDTEKQFILTTHSSSLLNMIKPKDVLIARLSKNGNSKLGRVNNIKELNKRLRKGYINFGDTLIYNIDEEDEESKTY